MNYTFPEELVERTKTAYPFAKELHEALDANDGPKIWPRILKAWDEACAKNPPWAWKSFAIDTSLKWFEWEDVAAVWNSWGYELHA